MRYDIPINEHHANKVAAENTWWADDAWNQETFDFLVNLPQAQKDKERTLINFLRYIRQVEGSNLSSLLPDAEFIADMFLAFDPRAAKFADWTRYENLSRPARLALFYYEGMRDRAEERKYPFEMRAELNMEALLVASDFTDTDLAVLEGEIYGVIERLAQKNPYYITSPTGEQWFVHTSKIARGDGGTSPKRDALNALLSLANNPATPDRFLQEAIRLNKAQFDGYVEYLQRYEMEVKPLADEEERKSAHQALNEAYSHCLSARSALGRLFYHPNFTGNELVDEQVAQYGKPSITSSLVWSTLIDRPYEDWKGFFEVGVCATPATVGVLVRDSHQVTEHKIVNGNLTIVSVTVLAERAWTEEFQAEVKEYVQKRDRTARHAIALAPYIGKFLA